MPTSSSQAQISAQPHLQSHHQQPTWEKARSPRTTSENGRGPSRFSGASRRLLPPREADHALPLNRLFEDLHKHSPLVGGPAASDLVPASHAPSQLTLSPPPQALSHEGSNHRQAAFSPPRAAISLSSPSFSHTRSLPDTFGVMSDDGAPVGLPERGLQADSRSPSLARLSVPPAGSDVPLQPVSAPASNSASRDPSPSPCDRGLISPPRRPAVVPSRTASVDTGLTVESGRPKLAVLRADSIKDKQLRRMQATQSMKNMESVCLSGLDSFGVGRGTAGKSRSSTPVAGSRFPIV